MSINRFVHRMLAPMIYRDGIALVPRRASHEWPERQFLRRLLRRLDADCVIDVGANAGQYALELRLIGFKGTIVSFEPEPASFAKLLHASSADHRWHVFNHALGSEAGRSPFNVMKSTAFSSFRKPTTRFTSHYDEWNQVARTVSVEVQRLDEVLPGLALDLEFERPFLKMDTQGFDLEVFRGASGVHDRLAGLQSELALQHMYENVPPWTDALAEYQAAGFTMAGIFAVNPAGPVLTECDCFFQRQAPG